MDFLYSLQAFLFSLCRARSGTPGPLEAHREVRQGCANKFAKPQARGVSDPEQQGSLTPIR